MVGKHRSRQRSSLKTGLLCGAAMVFAIPVAGAGIIALLTLILAPIGFLLLGIAAYPLYRILKVRPEDFAEPQHHTSRAPTVKLLSERVEPDKFVTYLVDEWGNPL